MTDNNEISKPSFRETIRISTMNLNDVGLQFNSKRVGPANFVSLRNADYGQGFRMPTMPEIVPLGYASLENQDYETTKDVIEALESGWITGNTGILYVGDGLYIQDNPELRKNKVYMDSTTLKNKLGSHEENGVVFSDDKSIRFTPYGFKTRKQEPSDLVKNRGIVSLVGGEENAEKLAKFSGHFEFKSDFFVITGGMSLPQIRVADLHSDGSTLTIVADNYEGWNEGYSFGVRKIKGENKKNVS